MIQFKEGVSVDGVTKECIEGMFIVAQYYSLFQDRDLVVTSVTDGKHGDNSLHYKGNAFDHRTWTTPTSGIQLSPDEKQSIAIELYKRLGDKWDVVVERTHIHCEYDPK